MKTGSGRIGLCVVFLLLLSPSLARADEIRTTCLVFTMPRLSQLVLAGDVSGLLTLSADASETAYDAGYVQSTIFATRLTLSTNAGWDLSARLSGTWSCPGNYDKNENDLFIRIANTPEGQIVNGSSAFINLSTTDLILLQGPNSLRSSVVDVQTRVLLDWTKDVPGAYSIPITYTLVTHVP